MKREDLRNLLDFHKAFWKKGYCRRPLFCYLEESEEDISEIKLANGNSVTDGMLLKPGMLSAETLHPQQKGVNVENKQLPYTKGDLFQTVSPYSKVPWVEAIVGCPIRISINSNSIWAEMHPNLQLHNVQSPSDLIDDRWLKKLIDVTRYLVANFCESYLVTQTSITRGPIDMLDALIGTEKMIVEMYTHPRQTSKILEVLAEVFIRVVKAQLDVIPTFQGGYCNPFGLWSPCSSIRAQDHASAVLSPRLYEQYVLPVEETIISQFDYTTYHTHSNMLDPEDRIAEIDVLDAIHIQVDPEPYGLSLTNILPKLEKIQEKKSIIIEGELTKNDVDKITKRLPPEGLCIIQRVT